MVPAKAWPPLRDLAPPVTWIKAHNYWCCNQPWGIPTLGHSGGTVAPLIRQPFLDPSSHALNSVTTLTTTSIFGHATEGAANLNHQRLLPALKKIVGCCGILWHYFTGCDRSKRQRSAKSLSKAFFAAPRSGLASIAAVSSHGSNNLQHIHCRSQPFLTHPPPPPNTNQPINDDASFRITGRPVWSVGTASAFLSVRPSRLPLTSVQPVGKLQAILSPRA